MPNTFTQIYIHIIFTVKGRLNLIPKNHKEELHKYITGIITKRDQKLISINGMPDHVHILVGIKPIISISDLTRDIKAASSKFIKEKGWIKSKFNWQEGYGAFSYSYSQLSNVIQYIDMQEQHHQKKTFREEYISFLDKFKVVYNKDYLFEFYE